VLGTNRQSLLAVLATALLAWATSGLAHAQSDGSAPSVQFPSISTTDLFNTTTTTVGNAATRQTGSLTLTALLADVGPRIDRGLTWRIFRPAQGSAGPRLIGEHREPSPTLNLPAGIYVINVAFGLAHLTRTITVKPGDATREQFIINAGGLKIIAKAASSNFTGQVTATYDLYADERDQFGERQKILSNMRPGRITRLNSGIYRIVSRLGNANAIVASEVTVEAGKLTEATVVHEAAKVTFKLVQSQGGDALADAQWIVMNRAGAVIMETAGAVPTHVLAPGDYTISARWGGRLHTRTFAIKSGDNVEVEVVIK
jgi:preprotein translocase subunit YajC